MSQMPKLRKGQGDVKLTREEFERRLGERFYDPIFDQVRPEIRKVMDVAWQTYDQYHKSPRTRKAGPGFSDPEAKLPVEWLETRERIQQAEREQKDEACRSRILLISGAARHDQTCPGGCRKPFAWREWRGKKSSVLPLIVIFSILACLQPNMGGRFCLAKLAYLRRCRFAIGRVRAIPTTPWGK
jgi:hypothetical protein